MAGKVKTDAADPLRLHDHGGGVAGQRRANLLFVPHAWWALLPIAVYSLRLGDDGAGGDAAGAGPVPERRGMASSLQAFIGCAANGLVAGVVAPLVMHSTIALAATSLAMMSVGVIAWLWVKPHLRMPALAPQSAS